MCQSQIVWIKSISGIVHVTSALSLRSTSAADLINVKVGQVKCIANWIALEPAVHV